ncbi:MAG TPA: hypothetical protein VED59_02870, partial [Acidimicrobiales bacterium]|nr:hypothetical protein [Acidimicrobiales bacterium]
MNFRAVAALALAADIIVGPAAEAASTPHPTGQLFRPAVAGTASCRFGQAKPMVEGHPHVSGFPSIAAVEVIPHQGSVVVRYKFHAPLILAPEGVYIAWTVYVYRSRSNARDPEKT